MVTGDTRPAAKPHYKIGEIAELLGVAPSAIRHWEKEFGISGFTTLPILPYCNG